MPPPPDPPGLNVGLSKGATLFSVLLLAIGAGAVVRHVRSKLAHHGQPSLPTPDVRVDIDGSTPPVLREQSGARRRSLRITVDHGPETTPLLHRRNA